MASTELDAAKKRWRPGGKYCVYGSCKTNSNNCEESVYFIPFPKPTTPIGVERAKRWINLCRRDGMSLEWINKNRYVCSQHFVDPRGPTDLNPDPVAATSSMAVCRKNPPKRLNYDRKKFICVKLKSKTVLVQQKHTIQKQPEDFAAKETQNIIVDSNNTSENQDDRPMEVNVPLHELLTPQCTLEERPQEPSRKPLLRPQNIDLKKVVQTEHLPVSQPHERQLHHPVVSDATGNRKDSPQSKQDDDRSSEGNRRVVPVAARTQTPDVCAPSNVRNNSVADVIVSCNNLVHAVMKRFDNWLVRFELESDRYTAHIVKVVNYQQTVSVDVTLRRDKFHVSVDVFKYRLKEGHPFWEKVPKPADLGGVVRLLDEVSQWQICLKLRSTPSYDMKPTTTCGLLCQLPCVMCARCRAETERRMSNEAGAKDPTEETVMKSQHRFMSKRALCLKSDILRKKLRAVSVQNRRLKARMARAVPPREDEERVEGGLREEEEVEMSAMDVDPFSMTREEVCAKFGVLRKVYKADSLKHRRLRVKLAKVMRGMEEEGEGDEDVVDDDQGKRFKMWMQHKYLSKDALCEKYDMLRNVLKALAVRNDHLKRRVMAVAQRKSNGVLKGADGNEQLGGSCDADDVEGNGADVVGDDGDRNGARDAESDVFEKEEYSEDVEESVLRVLLQ